MKSPPPPRDHRRRPRRPGAWRRPPARRRPSDLVRGRGLSAPPRPAGIHHRALGHGRSPGSAFAPFLADALRHREVAWCQDGRPVRVQPLPSPALGLSRHALDDRLARAFTAAGGDLRTAHALRPISRRVRGRIFATGRRRGPIALAGPEDARRAASFRSKRDLELHLGEDAYVGLSAVEGGRVNVCGLFRRRPLCGEGRRPAARLSAGRGPRRARRPARRRRNRPRLVLRGGRRELRPERAAADRVCLGDACAMIPPFTGNGMAMAFQSAEIALDPLLAYARGEAGRGRRPAGRSTPRCAGRFRLRLASADMLHPYLLRPPRQRWLLALGRAHLLPLRPLYAMLH